MMLQSLRPMLYERFSDCAMLVQAVLSQQEVITTRWRGGRCRPGRNQIVLRRDRHPKIVLGLLCRDRSTICLVYTPLDIGLYSRNVPRPGQYSWTEAFCFGSLPQMSRLISVLPTPRSPRQPINAAFDDHQLRRA